MEEVTREGAHRVSNLEARAGPEARDELAVQTGGVEGQRKLLWDVLELQLHLGANFLARATSLVVDKPRVISSPVAAATTRALRQDRN